MFSVTQCDEEIFKAGKSLAKGLAKALLQHCELQTRPCFQFNGFGGSAGMLVRR
ncbi:hypothetical protein V22_00420 [Calycomorphotria hydatis]|uniref:Uncharacterized protein n=1 Tax=Calycomorphotria hydatis TaxID=2528027 RepID=A0A517T389_9PLAN|nr:hypothetical protein V22_00420 [Calycomorphotria hydatis]